MVEIRLFHRSGGALSDSQQLRNRGFAGFGLEAFKSLPQGFRHYPSHGFPCGLRDSLSEAVGFRILDVQTSASAFPYHLLPFYPHYRIKSLPAGRWGDGAENA